MASEPQILSNKPRLLNSHHFSLAGDAYLYSKAAHAGQKRKYTGEPYFYHPIAVASIVATVDHTPEMLAAALLHDVIEDTNITIMDIEVEFGKTVAMLVDWLTDVSRPEDGNRATRKTIDREHASRSPAAAQTIKLADLIHNSQSILMNDAMFAKVYIPEKTALLNVLTSGDPVLWKQASEILRVGTARIEAQSTANIDMDF